MLNVLRTRVKTAKKIVAPSFVNRGPQTPRCRRRASSDTYTFLYLYKHIKMPNSLLKDCNNQLGKSTKTQNRTFHRHVNKA